MSKAGGERLSCPERDLSSPENLINYQPLSYSISNAEMNYKEFKLNSSSVVLKICSSGCSSPCNNSYQSEKKLSEKNRDLLPFLSENLTAPPDHTLKGHL